MNKEFKDYLTKNYPSDFVEAILNKEGKHYKGLIINLNKVNKDLLKKEFSFLENHPDVKECLIYPPFFHKEITSSPLYELGAYYIQDPSASLVPSLLDIKEDDIVLDMCAAPGGKTILASLLANKGLIISNEKSYQRAKILEYNVAKMGLGNVIVTCEDFIKTHAYHKEEFSKIILDAPCSGTFMFSKEEKMEKDWSLSKVRRVKETQLELLKAATYMLKEGGSLIYSTCSLLKEENEDNVFEILNINNNLFLEDLSFVKNAATSNSLPSSIYLYPFLYPGEGQYIALIKKKGVLTKKECKSRIKSLKNEITNRYGLDNRFNIFINDYLFSLPFYYPYEKFNVLRLGVPIYRKNHEKQLSFGLARYLSNIKMIELNEDEYNRYLKGEEIKKENAPEDATFLLSYLGLPLSFSKLTNGKLKNYYPKSERKLK